MSTHTMSTETTVPAVYVGTYAKYNAGSLKGAWLKLEDYAGRDAFLTACAELHKDEADPELMFQDYEGFPEAYYTESSVPDELWEWLELDESDRELLAVYSEHTGDKDADIEKARDAFMGTHDSERAWAENWLAEAGMLSELPEWARNGFDYDAYANDARCGGDVSFCRHNGELWVFNNNA